MSALRVLDFVLLPVKTGDAFEFRIGDENAQRVATVRLRGELGLTTVQAEGVAAAVAEALIFLGGPT